MNRTYTKKIYQLIEAGILNHEDVLDELLVNWLSEDDVKEFYENKYEDFIEENYGEL